MSDLELLFLVLALIYIWECACWVPRGSVAFRTWFGSHWRAAHPGGLLGNQRGGFIFAHPFPPLGTLLTATQFPLSLSSEAVLGYVASSINPGARPAQTEKFFRFDDIRTVEGTGKKVRVNGQVLLQAASWRLAERIAERLRELSRLDPAKRESALETMARASLDTKAIKGRWEDFKLLSANVRLLANSLFGYLFVFAPFLIWHLGLSGCWLGLLSGLLALTFATALVFRRAHKTLYPPAQDERFTHFLTILLSPATTLRAHDVLSRPLLETFHPLALAKVFCAERQFRAFARRVLLEIRYPALPVCPREEAEAQATERYSRAVLRKAVEKFLKQSGIDPEELAQPPAPADETCRSYCPRCLAQFTTREGVCADCGGLALISFSAAAAIQEQKGGC